VPWLRICGVIPPFLLFLFAPRRGTTSLLSSLKNATTTKKISSSNLPSRRLSGGNEEKYDNSLSMAAFLGDILSQRYLNLETGVLTSCPSRPVVFDVSGTPAFKFEILSDMLELTIYATLHRTHKLTEQRPRQKKNGKLNIRAVHRGQY